MTEKVQKEIVVYDEKTDKIIRGYNKNIGKLPDVTHLEWDATGVNTNVKPTIDTIIDVEMASSITIQADTTHPDNTSTSIDINVMALLEGEKWDTVPYAEMNLGDAEVKTMLVEPGVKKIKLRVDNNASATTGYVRAIVKVRE